MMNKYLNGNIYCLQKLFTKIAAWNICCEHAHSYLDTSMMAAAEVENVSEAVNSLDINGDSTVSEVNNDDRAVIDQWGFSQEELYRIALSFYKGKYIYNVKIENT